MQAIVSSPASSGAAMPRRSSSRSRIACLSFGVTPTEPMPCTLEWPRIGSRPALRPADHAAQQRQVGDHLHVLDAVQVVRDAHRPAEHDVLRRHVHLGDARDRLARERRRRSRSRSRPSIRPAARTPRSPRCGCSRNAASWPPRSSTCLATPVSSARSPPMCGCTYRLAISAAEQQAPRIARHAEVDQARSPSPG